VFDLDGLMFNTEDVFTLAGTELLRRRNKPAPREMFDRMMGRRPHEAIGVMIDMMELSETTDELLAESERLFRGLLDEWLAPMPGLFELLQLIEARQLPKGVATSSPRHYLLGLLRRFQLEERFAVTLTAEDVTHGKPHPEIYLKAAERMGVAPAEMLVLEDSAAGTQAAAAAGAHIISVPHVHSRGHDFSRAKGVASSLVDRVILELLDRDPLVPSQV
jgi:HAD superfamily hydrolase (TIGR01509 family)